MALHAHETGRQTKAKLYVRPQLDPLGQVGEIPKLRLARSGMPPSTAYEVIHDELLLDGSARLNMATFVTTWMEPQAEVLMAECASKNMIDKDEYPQTAELECRCVNILADLWHAEETDGAAGCSTTGSSEACMLGGLALKWQWRQRRQAAGLPADRPNLVMGSNVQVCWEKFCRYWDVEARLVPVGPEATCLTAQGALAHCDENTIGVVAVLGSTFDGAYEPVKAIADALDELAGSKGIDVPLHVDGASGGFIAPFLDPDLEWDFRLPRVKSINTSGHKFGLVYPGVGWIIWRNQACLPDDLVFKVDYLGGSMPTFSLNFSRPGAQVVAQYYNFLRLGSDGYRQVQQDCRDTTRWLAEEVSKIAPFQLVSTGDGIPAFAFRIGDAPFTVYDVSETLRTRGWLVPAYAMPPALDHMSVLRIVVRSGFSRDLASLLVEDLKRAIERLQTKQQLPASKVGFHH